MGYPVIGLIRLPASLSNLRLGFLQKGLLQIGISQFDADHRSHIADMSNNREKP